jgi:hypothetical protein
VSYFSLSKSLTQAKEQGIMTTAIGTGATSKEVRETTDRELTADELEHVSGGKPSAAPKDPPVKYVSYEFSAPTISGY